MRAMILAAGRGARMKALTDHSPKPLLKVHGRSLIEYAVLSLKEAGISEIVINLRYYGDQIEAHLQDGAALGVRIQYSYESEPLETGGGVIQALPLLGKEPFIVISADVLTSFDLRKLHHFPKAESKLHLVMVPNPPYVPHGDFGVEEGGMLTPDQKPFWTMGNIGLYHPSLFDSYSKGYLKLVTVFKEAIVQKQASGEVFFGDWFNLGTEQDWLDVCTLPATHPVFRGNARPSECNPPGTPTRTAVLQNDPHIPCSDPG